MLWFEDVSALNEPVLSFPVLGRISMKQFFILGVTGMASYAMFLDTHNFFSLLPVCVGALLAFVKPKVGTSEETVVSLFLFLARRYARQGKDSGTRDATPPRKKGASQKKLELSEASIRTRTITLSDLSRPVRFKIRLVEASGQAVVNRTCKVYLDDSYTDTLTTDLNGEIETVIIPKTSGKRRITVYVGEQKEPAFSEVIEIRTSDRILLK